MTDHIPVNMTILKDPKGKVVMTEKNIIKCAFCDWTCKRWRTNAKGQRINNYYLLKNHCVEKHSDLDVVQVFLHERNATFCWCGEIHSDEGHPYVLGGRRHPAPDKGE